MRFSQVAAASLVAPLVAAHGMEGMPRIVGLPRQLRASNPLAGYSGGHAAQAGPVIRPRQSTDGRCGPDGGNQKCADNECCSSAVRISNETIRVLSLYLQSNRDTAALLKSTAKRPTACSTLDLHVV